MKLFAIALVVTVAVLAGCGEDEVSSELPQEGTLFTYTRAGGIAFSVLEVKIDADGTGTIASNATADTANTGAFNLSDAEMGEFRSILEETPISSLPDPGDPMCADCFEHTYAYGGDKITLTEVSDPVPELRDLNDFIDGLPLPSDQPNGG